MAKKKKLDPYIDSEGKRRDPNRRGHPVLCSARTVRGNRLCGNIAMPNGKCKKHGGPSTGPKTERGKQVAAMSSRLKTTTGANVPIWYDSLTVEEQTVLNLVSTDADTLLIEEIQLTTIRERRMMNYIKVLQEFVDNGLTMDSVQESWKRFIRRDEGGKEIVGTIREDGSIVKATDMELVNKLIVKDDPRKQIQEIEEALTRVQGHKHKLIELLHKLTSGTLENGDGSLKQLNGILDTMRKQREKHLSRVEKDKERQERAMAEWEAEQENQ